MPKKLLQPEGARDFLARRYQNQHLSWLVGEASFPLTIPLGTPTEKEALEDLGGIREWVAAWSAWNGPAEVIREMRQWPRLGEQELPTRLVVRTPGDVAAIVGQYERWSEAVERFRRITSLWPLLSQRSLLALRFDVLVDYSAADFERLLALLVWLEEHRASRHYLRQLPVLGLDTKWVEQRMGVVAAMLRGIRGVADEGDFYELCGLKKPPHRIRLRVLCPALRKTVGGLRDIEAPHEELSTVPLAPTACVIVENLETGLSMPDMQGVVCIMKLGHAVSVLGGLPWLGDVPTVYWGDIDTHGFAILDRARRVLPQLQSVLMDEQTLLAYRSLCGHEPAPYPGAELPTLHEHERRVYEGLRNNVWGQQLRLEQERLPWEIALTALRAALKGDV